MNIDTQLCSRCASIFSTFENLKNIKYVFGSRGYRHYNESDLAASASKGCKLCTLLVSETRTSWRNVDNAEIVLRVHDDSFITQKQSDLDVHPFYNAGKDLFINVTLLPANDDNELYNCTFILVTTTDNDAAKYIKGRPIPTDVYDLQSQNQIQTWLRDCQNNHQCSQVMAKPRLPTRVLDLSGPQPCLHVSAQDEHAEYACLSYCWGGPQDVLTTKANLEAHIKGLPLDKLPQTLQDAISVTKTLGLRFLWIDALCIIQDCMDDKAIEITKMGSIYRDATMTVFATSASRVGEGFLQHRIPDHNGITLPFYVSETTQGAVTMMLKSDPDTLNEPLDSRAWVVQETLLSRRRLMYGTREVLWKCQEDDYQTLTTTPRYYDMLMTQLPGDILFAATQDGPTQRQKQLDNAHADHWRTIVRYFTSREITNRDDRLPAIGGIAAELQKSWKDDYIVGAWRRTLAPNLMWYRLANHETASLPRPVEYRAPTWSWASVDCAVDLRPVEFIDVEVISCDIQLHSPLAPFGSASSGELILKAKVLTTAQIKPEKVSGWKYIPDTETGSSLGRGSVCVLFGFHNGRAVGIVLRVEQDDNYSRIGSFGHDDSVQRYRGDRNCVWKRSEVVIEELRVI